MNRWTVSEIDGWHFEEDLMKEDGIYITARHPTYGGFILIFSDRYDTKNIEEMRQNLMAVCEVSYEKP